MARFVILGLQLVFLGMLGCTTAKSTLPYPDSPPPEVQPTRVDYVDSEAFDALFETALINQDPVIIVHTDSTKPDWSARLNAWIAAWNMGGKAEVGKDGRKVRLQAPFIPSVRVDGDSIREFRLLVDSLMNRVEDVVKEESAWWKEDRLVKRRVRLLKPYSLRFHMDADKHIQLIFFNGLYAQHYGNFMKAHTSEENEDSGEWMRGFTCSECK